METKFTNDYEKLESVDFFDAMQCYRISDQANQENVIKRFEEVKDYIKENFVPKTAMNSKAPEMFEMLVKVRQAILSDDYTRMLCESQSIKQLLEEATEL